MKKSGHPASFNTVITIKGQEENLLPDSLRRLLLPIIIIALGFLIYWIYTNYLSSHNLFGLLQEKLPAFFAEFFKYSSDFFS